MDKHGESGRALDDGADGGAAGADYQVAFPVPGHGSIVGLRWSFTDHDLVGDVTLRTLLCAGSRNAQRSSRSKTRDEFTFQRAAALDVERLVDRLVGDPHRLVVGKVDRQPVRDLLRAPRARPHPILSAGPVAALPGRSRRSDHRPIRCVDNTSEAILHVVTEPIIDDQFRRPRPAGSQLRLPLRDPGPILELRSPSRSVAAELT